MPQTIPILIHFLKRKNPGVNSCFGWTISIKKSLLDNTLFIRKILQIEK